MSGSTALSNVPVILLLLLICALPLPERLSRHVMESGQTHDTVLMAPGEISRHIPLASGHRPTDSSGNANAHRVPDKTDHSIKPAPQGQSSVRICRGQHRRRHAAAL